VLPLLNKFARVPVSGLVAQYNAPSPGDGIDQLPSTMRAILSKSLTMRGFINYDFAADHYGAFLREVGAGIADGRIRYREDFVDGLEKAPKAFIGMLEGRNFGKLIVRVDGGSKSCVRRQRGKIRRWRRGRLGPSGLVKSLRHLQSTSSRQAMMCSSATVAARVA
jgi:hypothetical protein